MTGCDRRAAAAFVHLAKLPHISRLIDNVRVSVNSPQVQYQKKNLQFGNREKIPPHALGTGN